MRNGRSFTNWVFVIGTLLLMAFIIVSLMGCAGGPLTTREKGAGIGALGGAAVGGIIGSTVGHPGAGAAIGGVIGLGAGAIVGDQLQGNENRQSNFDPRDLVGQKESDAVKAASAAGYSIRIMRRDNERFSGTADNRTDRVTLEIDRGIVSSAKIQ